MRICRYDDDKVAVVTEAGLHDATEALAALTCWTYPLPAFDPFVAALPRLRSALEEAAKKPATKTLAEARILSPVANPGKIVAAPVNYVKHLEEVLAQRDLHHGNLINEIHRAGLFLKATSSLVGPSHGVDLVHLERRSDHELELAVVIGATAWNVPAERALDYVAGYCMGLDITIRGPEERSLRKSPDSYTVLGPWLVTADEFGDPSDVSFRLDVNGETRQQASTRELVLGVPQLIAFASSFYTLRPGDVIMTGTPQGVGPIKPGDELFATMQGIGEMRVAVRARD